MHQAPTLQRLTAALVPGQTYRRADFAELSSNVDRHLAQLLSQGALRKLSQGLYTAPRSTTFGEGLPDETSLLRAFLKDDRFVVYSPSQFNALELGTSQLYNRRVVFNRKRVGEFTLGGRVYTFHRWREAPKTLTLEFLVVEFLNRLKELADDPDQALTLLQKKLRELDRRKLAFAASHYGTLSTQKHLEALMKKQESEETP